MLGATAVRVKADKPADRLIAFVQREGVAHVIFGQSARTRWELLVRGSSLDRFLSAIPDAAVRPDRVSGPERTESGRGCTSICAAVRLYC
jgi:two-component system, OmpR family, sensor histidine kinase KdpD